MGKMISILLLCACLLSGCTSLRPKNRPLCRVVERVEVVCQRGENQLLREYTDSEKKKTMLNYLRLLKPRINVSIVPDAAAGDDFHITLYLSDGETVEYHQKAEGYLSVDGGDWKRIDPEKGKMLMYILKAYESDIG